MSIQLIFLRHGIAVDPEGNRDDFTRELTEEGEAILERSLAHLRPLLRPAEEVILLSSPRVRAVQTARIAARLLDLGEVVIEPFVDRGLFGDLVDYIAKENDGKEKRIVIVGHEPTLGYWTGMLCGRRKALAKGEAVSITLASGDIRSSKLDWAMRADDMMRLTIHRSSGDARTRESSVLAARFAALSAVLREYSLDTDPVEVVHQIRTTSRRVSASLALYKPILNVEAYRETLRLAKTIGKNFSHIRDADVLLQLIERYREKQRDGKSSDTEFTADEEEMARRVTVWRDAQVGLLADRLKLPAILRRLDPLCTEKAIAETFFRQHENGMKPFEIKARIARHREKLTATARRLGDDDKQIHEFRTLVRRLRYMEELLLPEETPAGEKLSGRSLTDLQESLGRYCDARKAVSILNSLGFVIDEARENPSKDRKGFGAYLYEEAAAAEAKWRTLMLACTGI